MPSVRRKASPAKTPMILTEDDLEKASTALATIAPSREFTPRRFVRELEPVIVAAMRKGCTERSIRAALANVSLPIPSAVFRRARGVVNPRPKKKALASDAVAPD